MLTKPVEGIVAVTVAGEEFTESTVTPSSFSSNKTPPPPTFWMVMTSPASK